MQHIPWSQLCLEHQSFHAENPQEPEVKLHNTIAADTDIVINSTILASVAGIIANKYYVSMSIIS